MLARIHAYTRQRKRREVEPVTAQDFMRFLLRWQHVAPDTRREGTRGVLAVVEQLQGFELAAGAWEKAIFPARVTGYRREWLDEVCLDGRHRLGPAVGARRAGRTAPPRRPDPVPGHPDHADDPRRPALAAAGGPRRGASRQNPDRAAPATCSTRWRTAARCSRRTWPTLTGRLPSEIEEALWDGVARGLVTADGFRAVRSLFARRGGQHAPGRRRLRRGSQLSSRTAGRWSLLPEPPADCDPDELAEAVAEQLAARWGVVFRDLLARENLAVPWREVLWALRRMEARGTISGGRFVTGFSGEQFAHPDAVGMLREIRKRPLTGETVAAVGGRPAEPGRHRAARPARPGARRRTPSRYTDGAVAAELGRPVLTA